MPTSLTPDYRQAAADPNRLDALERLGILDTPGEIVFDRVAALIKLIFGVEIGIVSMIDAHRQWYKAVDGLENTEVSLDSTFCKHTLQLGRPLIVPDASQDERFFDNAHVTGGPKVRFYASAPITTVDGQTIGTVCAIDGTAREFSERDTAILTHLAAIVMHELELQQEASTDVLTGARSRRAFKDEAGKHLALAVRYAAPLSCIAFDIDHFKQVNDTYGHAAGDRVLASVAKALKDGLRESDLVGRVGGEEFAIILPRTEHKAAMATAEKLRAIVKGLDFPGTFPPIAVTASFGVSTIGEGDDLDTLLERADQMLYVAKRSGRNQVCGSDAPTEPPKPNRRRVLKAGQVIFDGGRSTYDCTIRSLWDGGAEFAVSLPMIVPDEFELVIKGTAERHACTLSKRSATSLEATFAA